MRKTWVQSLGWEDPLEKGKATYSNIMAWRIPWTTVHGIAKSWTQLSDLGLVAELIRSHFPHPQNGLNTIQGPVIRQNFVACDVLLTLKV